MNSKFCAMRTSLRRPWLPPILLVLICFSGSVSISSATHFYKIPRLGRILHYDHGSLLPPTDSKPHSSAAIQENFYDQTLDHFNFNPVSYTKFKQYYVINYKYWGGANSSSPIFAYLGDESPLSVPAADFLTDNAPRFKALLVYIEHRFYGQSNPLGSLDKSLANKDIRGYFNSAQALADYAEILLHVKKKLSAHNSPIIVVGASYGGLLASWLRLKYPHVALGALASSAPILYFDNITPQSAYYFRVTEDFKDVSENCYQTIRDSWSMIDKVASQPNGLTVLSQKFKTCAHLNKSSELKEFLARVYIVAAQYDAPPTYPVTQFCSGVDKAPKGTNVLGRIFAGMVSLLGNNISCYPTSLDFFAGETRKGFGWQLCSEVIFPLGIDSNDTMFPPSPFILKDYTKSCIATYGVAPRPHWITTYYGGHDIKLVLKRFGSNIIFSNGLRDPYSTGGVLENLSETLVAVYAKRGTHGLDIQSAKKTDPGWLVAQRKIEAEIIGKWLKTYYADLAAIMKERDD